jgi:hypothetical protein
MAAPAGATFRSDDMRLGFCAPAEDMRDALDDLLRVDGCVEQVIGEDGVLRWRLAGQQTVAGAAC